MKIDQPAIKAAQRQAQGVALTKAIRFLKDEHVDLFRQKQVNGYILSLGSEEAEGMYRMDGDELRWKPPEKSQNQHIELVVQDADDLRFVPYLEPLITIIDESGETVAEATMLYMWHPVASHYGANVQLPSRPNEYTYQIAFKPPEFPRHDEVLGKRFTKPVSVTFEKIKPDLDREPRGPE